MVVNLYYWLTVDFFLFFFFFNKSYVEAAPQLL